jgi:hypothetical protein
MRYDMLAGEENLRESIERGWMQCKGAAEAKVVSSRLVRFG